MTFQMTKSIRQFSPFLPKPFTLRPLSTCPLRPRLSIQAPSIPINSLFTRTAQPSQTTVRPYGIKLNEDELDLISPPAFIPSLLTEGKKILRHILVTFEAFNQGIGGQPASAQVLKKSLSKDFFKTDLEFSEHLTQFFASLEPHKTKGEGLILAVKAYADCRAKILQTPTTTCFVYNDTSLTMLPPEITLLRKLDTLSLDENALSTFPSILDDSSRLFFPSLTTLYLGHNRFSSLSSFLNHCPNLLFLDLQNNNLTNLPSTFSGLNTLKRLDISHNDFTAIPPVLFALPLTNLVLSHNKIAELPSAFYDTISYSAGTSGLKLFQNLVHLNLSYNELEQFLTHKAFFKLQTLDLSCNRLSSYQIIRSANPQLRYINLDANRIQKIQIEPEILGQIGLERLDLAHNPLSNIPQNLLKEIPQVFITLQRPPSASDMIGC